LIGFVEWKEGEKKGKDVPGLKSFHKFFVPTIAVLLMLPAPIEAKTSIVPVDQQLKQVTAQKEKAKLDQAQTLQKLSSVKQEKVAANQESSQLQSELDAASNQLTQVETKLSLLDDGLKKTKGQLDDANNRVTSHTDQLKAIVQSIYMNGTQSYFDVLLGATSFSDFLDRLNDLVMIGSKEKELLAANENEKKLIQQDEQHKQQDLDQQAAL
jgi:peptidoglycan hydrolase CwlO-like protein